MANFIYAWVSEIPCVMRIHACAHARGTRADTRDKESNMKAAVLAATGLALVLAGCSSSYDNDYPMGLPNDTLTLSLIHI